MTDVTVLAVTARTEATAGKTDVGGNAVLLPKDYNSVCKYDLPDNANVTALVVYMGALSADCKAKAVIYADDAGSPAALLGTSNEVAGINTDLLWRTFTFAAPVALGVGTYWLGVIVGDNHGMGRYSGGSTNQMAIDVDAYADGPENPFGAVSGYVDYALSVHAVYGGANVKLPTIRISKTIAAVVAQASAAVPLPTVVYGVCIRAVVAQAVAEAFLAQVRLPGPRIVPGRGEASSDARPRAYAETEPALQASASTSAPFAPADAGTQPPLRAHIEETHE